MKKAFLFLVLFFLFYFSCSIKQTELRPEGISYSIDLDGKKEISIPFSSIFKNVRTIILETDRDCLIGQMSELQVFDGYIYVLDSRVAKSLFVFNMEGRFIRKIGSLGKGPGEFIRVYDFTIDTENRFIFLIDQGNRIHKYQMDGTYINSINVQIERSNIMFIQSYNARLYADVVTWEPTHDDDMLLEIDPSDGKILSHSLSLRHNKGWAKLFHTGNSFFKSRLNSPPRYSQLFMNYVVTVGETVIPYIELKSKYLVTDEDLKNLPEGKHMSERLKPLQEGSKIWNVHSFVENDNFIVFTYQSGLFVYITAVFHKETRMVRLANYLSNDMIFKNDESSMYGRFAFSDTKGAYEILYPNMFDDFQESIRNKEVVADLDKADHLIKLMDEANPIIFYYEFK